MWAKRYSLFFALIGLLVFSLANSEMPISLQANLDSFSHELDGATIRIESLSTRWQLSTDAQPRLVIDTLNAKRLTITLKPGASQASSGMPENIQLPMPINVNHATIKEVVVINSDDQFVLQDVVLAFKGDTRMLNLELRQAKTPWGDTNGALTMSPKAPFALTGAFHIVQTTSDIAYDLGATLQGDATALEINSKAWLTSPAPTRWQLTSNTPNAPAPVIELKAKLALVEAQTFSAHASLSNFKPDQIGDYPAALLHLQVSAQGQLSPSFQASVTANSINSAWNQTPLEMRAQAQFSDTQTATMALLLKLGQNQFQSEGQLSLHQSDISWQANLDNLAELDKRIAGKLNASGQVTGDLNAPQLQWQVLANGLELPNHLHIQHLQGQATLHLSQEGLTEARISANNVRLDQQAPFDALLTLNGHSRQHRLVLDATGDGMQWNSALEGGLSRADAHTPLQWIGQLNTLDFSGLSRVKLTAPAPLLVDRTQVKLGKTALQLTQGNVEIDHITLKDHAISSQGQLRKVSLNDLPKRLVERVDTLKGDPVFSGHWWIEANTALNAKLVLTHEAGDLSYRKSDNTMAPLGLNKAQLQLDVKQNHAHLYAEINGSEVGHAKLDLTTTFAHQDDRFSLRPEAPLQLNASAELHTLAWLPMPTALMDGRLDGQLTFNVQANGTLAKPHLTGQLLGQQIAFDLPSEGLALTQGQWVANFSGRRLNIEQASWQGGEGRLSSQGWAAWQDGKPTLALDWNAQQFTVLSRADRLLTLSGTGKTLLEDQLLTISGQFKVDKGLIDLPNQDLPVLDNDVVILGQSSEPETPPMQVLLNGLSIQLGDQFSLRGRGLDAMLSGTLTMNGLTQQRPHTQGSIRVSKGTFMAYGQVLNIERGILNFSGLMDNPGLDIRAMRNSKPVNAGIEITGNAYVPMTKLVSTPNVAESEKLAWLVLGHGLESAGKNDYGLLSLAAGVLLSQGQSVPLQTQLARAAGLDELSFTGGDAESASLTLGKRITSQIYLSYAKSITGLLDIARLTFNITPRWLLRAEAGTESAVDVLYTFSFQ